MMNRRTWLAVGLTALLPGCGGWYLRGTRTSYIPLKYVFIRFDASSYLYSWLVTHLGYSGIAVVTNPAQADAVIELRNERYDRRVLSVDEQTGKVREMELGLEVEVTVRGPNGDLIAAPENVTWTQDFVFDEASLLGTEEVETTIRYELAKDAARALMFRLEAIDFSRLKKTQKNAT